MCKREYTLEENKAMVIAKNSSDKCYYCKRTLKDNEKTIDHLTPVCRGGQTVKSNLVVSCKFCNNEKDYLNELEYLEFLNNLSDYYKKDTVLNYLKGVMVIHTDIIDKHKQCQENLKSLGRERKEIEDLIEFSTVNASEMYCLGRDLKITLKKIRKLRADIEKLNKIKDSAEKSLESANKEFDDLKLSLRSSYAYDFKIEKKSIIK